MFLTSCRLRVPCSSSLMIGFFITCLIILMAIMFVSTVYCCYGVRPLCLSRKRERFFDFKQLRAVFGLIY